MNDLAPVANACWAKAATERFDLAGKLVAHVDIAPDATPHVSIDDAQFKTSTLLAPCMQTALLAYPWAPPLRGQSFEIPFHFSAPDGQSTIDRRLVAWRGQGDVSVAVLLDEANTGNANASMFELAIKSGGTTGLRWADRAELWYFLGAAEVSSVALAPIRLAAGDVVYAPKGSAREIKAIAGDVHAVIVVVPGGREGAARAGALPTPEVTSWRAAPMAPIVLRAIAAQTFGPATIYLDASVLKATPLAASVLQLPDNAVVAEHVHAHETEMLYVLAGAGTMTVAGTGVPVTETSAVQIPPNVPHSFVAHAAVRALQIYTPPGPEQRFKKAKP
jgi:quercetin dioxygenase-like cupin family protein